MATPPLGPDHPSWPKAVEAIRLHRQGMSKVDIAEALGASDPTVGRWIRAAARVEDPAIQAAKDAVGTYMRPALAWAKTKNEDGTSYSVLLKPDPIETDTLDRIREAFEGMEPAKPVKAPTHCDDDLLAVYPIADAHVGMVAWAKETGEAYDARLAAARITDWIGRAVASSPKAKTAVILDVGDLMHANDNSGQTPKHKNVLDVDTRHFRNLDITITALGQAVEIARRRHEKVIVRILPGNHDPEAFMAVLFALYERYRDEPRVEVVKEPGEFWVMEWGNVMLCAHHGDKATAQRIVLSMADDHAEMWGRTKHRFLFTGDKHHHKSQDIGGVVWEQLRALTARDAYAVSNAYTARAQLQGITYHRERGEVQRVKVGL